MPIHSEFNKQKKWHTNAQTKANRKDKKWLNIYEYNAHKAIPDKCTVKQNWTKKKKWDEQKYGMNRSLVCVKFGYIVPAVKKRRRRNEINWNQTCIVPWLEFSIGFRLIYLREEHLV